MANKVGPLIKQARTNAKLTQEQLAAAVEGVTASDIGKAERGEKELSQTALKQIAKATGVTQKSLIEAAASSTYGTAKKSSGEGKKSSSSSKKTETSKKKEDEITLSKSEKQLVELYRKADSETKKRAVAVLKGEANGGLLGDVGGDILTNLINGAAELLTKK